MSEAWVTNIESTGKASSMAILSNETTWLPAEYWQVLLFLGVHTRKMLIFKVFVLEVYTLVSIFKSFCFAWSFHRSGVNGKLKRKEIFSFSPNSVIV